MAWLARLFGRAAAPAPAPAPEPDAVFFPALPPMLAAMPIEAALARVGTLDPSLYADVVRRAAHRWEIGTPERMAAFLANCVHETNGFRRLREDLTYSAKRMTEVWPSRFPTIAAAQPYAFNPPKLAEKTYGGRLGNGPEGSGDGWLYIGRGWIQVTGKANYEPVAEACGIPVADLPAWMETPEGAAMSAAAWWNINNCNVLADTLDIEALRRRVNGKLIGFEQVRALYRELLPVLRGASGFTS